MHTLVIHREKNGTTMAPLGYTHHMGSGRPPSKPANKCEFLFPVDNFGTVVGENPDCLLLSGTVVGENPDHVCWVHNLSLEILVVRANVFWDLCNLAR